MNYRMIIRIISHIMWVEAFFLLPALGVAFYYGEAGPARALAITIVLLCVFGALGQLLRPRTKSFYAREGFVVVGLTWVVMSLFGGLPFYLSGEIPSMIDCFFETVSGFTTTGASILTDVEALSMSLLYWRSFTHWLGGMGVLVFLLALAPMLEGTGSTIHLLRAEIPGPQVGKLVPRVRQTAKILYGIYIGMTVVQILFLLAGDIPLFDALTISFGTAGTGGFAIKNASLGEYSAYIQTVVTIFMALFGVNFNVYYLLLIKEFRKAFRSEEVRAYLLIMGSAIVLIACNIRPLFNGNFGQSLHHAAFQVSSIMTTTGFATVNFDVWPEFSRMLLTMLMLVGACAGSTGGGIKVARILLLLKAAKKEVYRMLHPRTVTMVHMDDVSVPDKTLQGTYAYMVFYTLIAVVSILLISAHNFAFESNITAVLACLNNIGPGLGLVGPAGNYSAFSPIGKLVLSVDMLIGRLEIFPLLILMMPSVWKRSLTKNEGMA